MKGLLLLSFVCVFSTGAFGRTFEELQGKYKISPLVPVPITNYLTLRGNGSITVTAKFLAASLDCSGRATIQNDIVNASLLCENGKKMVVEFDLRRVEDTSSFTVPVSTNTLGTIRVKFKKLD